MAAPLFDFGLFIQLVMLVRIIGRGVQVLGGARPGVLRFPAPATMLKCDPNNENALSDICRYSILTTFLE